MKTDKTKKPEQDAPKLPLTEAVQEFKAQDRPAPDMTQPPVETIESAPEMEPAPIVKPLPLTLTTSTKLMVKPTALGLSTMQEKHDAMLAKVGSAVRGAYPRDVLQFRACGRAGWVTYSIQEMVEQFGPDAALGKALPFEADRVEVMEGEGAK